jgi:hypothetical protein
MNGLVFSECHFAVIRDSSYHPNAGWALACSTNQEGNTTSTWFFWGGGTKKRLCATCLYWTVLPRHDKFRFAPK